MADVMNICRLVIAPETQAMAFLRSLMTDSDCLMEPVIF